MALEPPLIKVVEICRATGLPPIAVLNSLLKVESIAEPTTFNGQDSRKWLDEVKTPKSSKVTDKVRAKIQAETQRYNRRFQFPNPPIPKTTRRRAESQIINWQLGQQRIRLKSDKNSKDEFGSIQTEQEISGEYREFSRKDLEVAASKAKRLIEILKASSVVPLERPKGIKEIFIKSALNNEPVIVLNWICPAGTPLEVAPNGSGLFRSYLKVNPELGLDKDYRLIPRLDLERKLIKAFERCEIPLWYIKLVADDNPYCLYPYSLEKDGESSTMRAHAEYARYTQFRLDQEIGEGKITVLTVSEFLGPERFRKLLRLFESTPINSLLPFLPENILEIEKDVISKHTNLSPSLLEQLDGFVEKVIRQYGCEGLMFYEMFGDKVIVAWNESTRRAPTIDAGRKSQRLPPFPKFFVLHRKRGNLIEDNF